MKKINLIIIPSLVGTALLLAGCTCTDDSSSAQRKAALEQQRQDALLEQDKKVISAQLDSLISATKDVKMAPFVTSTKDGRFVLTEKEKMVKPDYLIAPSQAAKAVTMKQRYHLTAMMAVDIVIANMYDMNVTDMKEAVAKLLVDLGDDAFSNFANTPWEDLEGASEAMKFLIEQEYEAGREEMYWESVAASLVEQLYIITRDVDKFMPMFTDESVFSITYNFVYLREGLMTLVSHNQEMNSINNVLAPLYVINAMSVDELRDELLLLKDDIERSREYLLK